jgi:hypothetical protein
MLAMIQKHSTVVCLLRVVFPMILLPLLAFTLLVVPTMSPVDAGSNHRGYEQRRDEEHYDTRERQSGALQAIRPHGIAMLP